MSASLALIRSAKLRVMNMIDRIIATTQSKKFIKADYNEYALVLNNIEEISTNIRNEGGDLKYIHMTDGLEVIDWEKLLKDLTMDTTLTYIVDIVTKEIRFEEDKGKAALQQRELYAAKLLDKAQISVSKKRSASQVLADVQGQRKRTCGFEVWSLPIEDIPLAIDFLTMDEIQLTSEFKSPSSAAHAVKGYENFARHIGTLEFKLTSIHNNTYEQLITAHTFMNKIRDKNIPWDKEGAFSTPHGQIPLSSVLDGEHNQEFQFHSHADEVRSLIQTVLGLQHPSSSCWNRPFLRLFSKHVYDKKNKTLSIIYYVYVTRLFLELISDDAIKHMMQYIIPPSSVTVIPRITIPTFPVMYTSASHDAFQNNNDFKFSIDGLLKQAESKGYPITIEQPDKLVIKLYEFQVSTYNWMLSQELCYRGINGFFWEHWKMKDGGGDMWYLPLGGEFRLHQPPLTRGGLLCEEMGMGKTVELISIILGNPSKSSDVTSKGQIYSRATLIVVPPILSSQWWRELHDRVIPGTLKCMNLTNRMLSREMEILDVSLSNMRFPSQGLNSWGDKRAIRFMAVGMTAEARFSWAPKVHVPVTIVSYSCLDDVIHRVKVKFTVRDLIHDNDVVITTYEWFRRHSAAYRRIHWHRVVLDECQQVKASSSDVAIDCANLDATYRWMVSGTPFVNSIADLHGELQFLRVWPFCLPDNEDGFWEKKIGIPFRHRDKNSLVLLHALIQAVMIRHSKSQCTLNGEALVKIPHRIVEWRAFEVTNSSELFIYKYIESFTAEAFQILLNNNRMHLRNPELLKMSTFINIRSLLTFMSQCLTHPGVLDLKKLDNIRRRLVGLQLHEYDDEDEEICLESHGVPKMSAGHALQHVQALGQGVAGGMNRESHRQLGNTVVSEMESRLTEKYKLLDVAALQAEVQRLDLPLPMIWQTLKCKADIDRGSVNMKCYPSDKSIKEVKVKALNEMVKPGDVLRIGNTDMMELEVMVTGVNVNNAVGNNSSTTLLPILGEISLRHPWNEESAVDTRVFKFIPSPHSEPYVRLLVSKELLVNLPHLAARASSSATLQIHSHGFETLYKLIAGRAVECPMCLSTEAIRPTVSRCVHCYCFSCIVDLVLREGYHAKCPICRRPVAFNTLIEIDSDDIKIEEAQEANDVSEDTGESRILPLKRDRETYDSSRDAQTTSSICSTSLPLNPLIQQLKETTHVKSTSTDRGMEAESEFIIPELCMEGVPAVAADLCTIPRPHCPLRSRMAGLPSLDPLPLTHFHMWQTNMLRHSARMIAVHQDMERELGEDQTTKFVIFSQYSECLSKLREMLDGSRIAGVVMSCASVLGGMRPVEREENLKRFAERPACNVCLLLLGAASSGLTLTNANVCYLLEPPHSAVDEAQALNRVHRIGQTKSVRCVVFYAKNTIEERLLGVRKAKRMLSELMQSVDTSSTPHIDSRNKPSAFFGLDALGAILGVRVEEQVAHIGTDDDDSDTDLSDFS